MSGKGHARFCADCGQSFKKITRRQTQCLPCLKKNNFFVYLRVVKTAKIEAETQIDAPSIDLKT